MSSLHQASLSLHDPLMFVIGGGEASFYHNLMRFSSGLEYPSTTTTTTTTSSSNSSYHHYNSSLVHNGDKAMMAFEDHHQDDLGMLPLAAVVTDPTTRAKTPTDADAILAIDETNPRSSTQHMPHQQQHFSALVVPTMVRRHLQDCSSSSSSRSEVPTSSLMPNSSPMAKEPSSKPMPTNATGMGPPPAPSRYESQKRRDWNTFGQYLKNHRPPLALTRCSGAHVLEFLRYLDHFGKTKVHAQCCPFYGVPQPSGGCACPLRQAWGSLDALIGRLRAAFEENGGRPESNPFGARAVRLYLREVRDMQAKARGIAYQKKKKKKKMKLRMKHGSADPSAQSHPVAPGPAPLVPAPPARNANPPHPHKNPNFILHYSNPTNLAATAYDNHILACNDPPPDHHDHDDPLFACLANH